MTAIPVTKNLSPRLQSIREKVINAPQEISLIRALAITEAVRSNPGLSRSLQFALGIKEALSKLPISISDDDRIVGSLTEKFKGAMLYPELKSDFIGKELNNFGERENDRFVISEMEKQQIRDNILDFWNEKSGYDIMNSMLSADTEFNARNIAIVIMPNFMGANLLTHINYDKVLSKGFNGIIKEAEATMNNLSDSEPDKQEKKDFYEAVIISAKAVIKHAERYSGLALELSNKAETSERAQELREIAGITAQVPAEPARTFREAVQSFWFTVLGLMHMDIPTELPYGRLDQILLPYYQKDINDGRITEAEALELVEELFIKVNGLCLLLEYAATKIYDGNNLRQTVTVGGIDAAGKSAVNDLSYIILDAVDNLKLIYPNIAVRLHPEEPEAFWKRVMHIMTDGSNLIEVFNDEVIIPGFVDHGFPVNMSRDYIIAGCVQPIPADTYGPNCSAFVNGPKVLEMALNGGKPYYSMFGDDEDLPVPEFKTYDELWNAFKLQLKAVVKSAAEGMDIVDEVQYIELPNPILSAVTDGTIESGRDVKAGGARYNYTGMSIVGIGTLTDSLAAIKELVFEKKAYSLSEVVEWIKSDFEGYESQRQMLKNHAPKYGNDIPWVDSIARDISDCFADILGEYKTYRGGIYGAGLHTENHHIIEGIMVAATPDGRKAGERLSPGCGPTSGMDQNGPTASLHSFAAIDYTKMMSGSSANMRVNPSILRYDNQVDQFEAMLRAYFKLGGQHLQISVVDAETLRDAQKNPEGYKDLIVRVTGYSARFVELTAALQEEIIKRSEMNVCG